MFWPLPLYRSYRTNADLTDLFVKFAVCDDLEVSHVDHYKVEVRCKHGRLNFWNANKPYGWASRGVFTPDAGERLTWQGEMPSRWAVVLMGQRLEMEAADGRFKLPKGTLK